MDLLTPTPRMDGALVPGDITSGQQAGEVPSRAPIEKKAVTYRWSSAARIVGDAVSGMPQNDQTATPDLTPVEKVVDSITTLPRREVEP